MNSIKLIILVALATVPLASANAEFVQGASDYLAADTLIMVAPVRPNASTGQLNVQVDLYAFSDGNNLINVNSGFDWDNPSMDLDSVVISPLAVSAFDFTTFTKYKTSVDSSNYYRRFLFTGISMTYPCLTPAASRRLIASYYFTLDSWDANDVIVIDTITWNGGTLFQFADADDFPDRHAPYWDGPLVIRDISVACCTGRVGDADGLGGDEPTIGDLSVMIDAKFITGTCDGIINCLAEADMNLSGGADPTCDDITLADISILQDYLFISQNPALLVDCY